MSQADPNGGRAVSSGSVTRLLAAWRRGDRGAGDNLLRQVYADLRRRAAAYFRHERPDHTLQPTALVHEAYLRLVGQDRISWQNRAQFFGVAAQMMRRILVDHARARVAAKRPDAGCRVELDERAGATGPLACEILLLHDALTELAAPSTRCTAGSSSSGISAGSPSRKWPRSSGLRDRQFRANGGWRGRGCIAVSRKARRGRDDPLA
jgi:RNA polymerase sigma factor (TIGR02999 family)